MSWDNAAWDAVDSFIAEKNNRATDETLTDVYSRFIAKNINVLSVSAYARQLVMVLEFSYERPKDGRIIWPKIAIEGDNLKSVVSRAEWAIDDIRMRTRMK